MLLWDEESEGWETALSGMSALHRKRVALSSMAMAVDAFRPPFEEMFGTATVACVRTALNRCDAEIRQAPPEPIGTEGFFDELHSLVDHDSALGLASLVMAISTYVGGLEEEKFSADCTLEVLSASYEAVLNSERIGRVTPEAERTNENCVQVIDAQRALISGPLGRLV
ncbi:hypothetical protein OG242_19410 [Streptomyces sp. NBC_00727]|uniref:hypothetical protein n=1 Tax=Streptomyces sp. NBC_00727 TaxID=2903675 RepID=UPI0038699D5C